MENHNQWRTHLPSKSIKSDCSTWSVLKNCVGKDLSRVTMPINFNEPISFLQRVAEHMEYSELLKKIDESDSPLQRIQYVGAFAVSVLSSNWGRLGKPFNPVIGETFELQRDGYRLLCEQVSHHPPISAFHVESSSFVFKGWVYPKLKLWGKAVEIHPKGVMKLTMKRHGETYTWKSINCTVHGIIVGKLWIEHHGTMDITCVESGFNLSLQFKPTGWFNKQVHCVDGFVMDGKKTKLHYVYGKWTETIKSCDIDSYEEYVKANVHKIKLTEPSTDNRKSSPVISPTPGKKILAKFNSLSLGKSFSTSVDNTSTPDGELSPGNDNDEPPKSEEIIDIPNSVVLWEVRPRPEILIEYYNFTQFALSLNEIVPEMEHLCPTDSRLRPDIRKMEEGDLEQAGEIKASLEERQRKFLKVNNEECKPLWFDKVGDDWVFNNKYWNTSKYQPHIANLF